MSSRDWTDEQVAGLKRLAPLRYTTAEIGSRIGKTRNAVIGYARRHKITLRGMWCATNTRCDPWAPTHGAAMATVMKREVSDDFSPRHLPPERADKLLRRFSWEEGE